MKKFFLLFIALLALSLVIACGGGEEETGDTKGADEPQEMAAPSGYTAMTVTDGGSISGRVTYSGTAPAKTKLQITKDAAICGKTTHYKEDLIVSGDKGLANVVVKITHISSGKGMDAMGSSFELDQNGCVFNPHVTLVPAGADLTILNSDGILHNIHTYSEANAAMNVAQPGFRKRMAQKFKEAEVIRVACDVHNWMGGYIVVTGHPYYAKTDADGHFEMSDVPAGTYTLEYWHETLGTQTMEVTVAAGSPAEANAEFAIGS